MSATKTTATATATAETVSCSVARRQCRANACTTVAAAALLGLDFEVVTAQHRYMGAGDWTGGTLVLARSWGLETCSQGRTGYHHLNPTCSAR